ncbi:unnamed protein product [Allacma fusca]|uniref:Exonuclease domain-containing protein n=1 Tax=Allacma fusca TaxID=39272 RepID=A0A8J2PJ72_9HEXA|nr:unnamed protein product [Allacma fusca]
MESGLKKAKVAQLIDQLRTLNNQDYLDVLCQTSVERPYAVIRKAFNYHQEHRKKGRGPGAGSVEECTPLTRPLRVSRPAWEVDLIYRGDLVPANGILYIDVEKVSLLSSHLNVAGTVAVVDSRRELVLWAIIRHENVCQFFPKLTGLSKDKIAMGIIPNQARCMLRKVLKGNTVVGAAVEQDLKSLDYDFLENRTKVVDLQDFFKNEKGPFKLLDLATHFFPNKQNFQCAKHSAISDARMTMKIAKKMFFLMKDGVMRYSEGIIRTKKPKFLDVGDKCTCSVTKKKYKEKPAEHRDWRDFEDYIHDTDPYDY